jgi:4'-phosphopantetheinyl transferase
MPPLLPNQVHIWQLPLGHPEQSAATFRLWSAYLSAAERDRMARFVFEPDRIRYGLSRGGLRQLLSRYLDCAPAALEFFYSAEGKPSLKSPSQPPALHFNLSHSGSWVVYGVSCDRPIGIDIEQLRPLQRAQALAMRCLTNEEYSAWAQLPVADAQRQFFAYWTSKEAYLKATGQGLTGSMTGIQADLTARLLTPRDSSAEPMQLYRWQPAADCLGALAYPGGPALIQRFELGEQTAG